jgi:nitrite reductase/ring-hydroxylating ferredoxin subunit
VSRAHRFLPLGPVSDLADGQKREYTADGVRLVVVRLDGELFALRDQCPHQGGPLGRGRLERGELICPWHQWRFDPRTGQSCWPEGYTRIARFPVKVEDGQILVDVG